MIGMKNGFNGLPALLNRFPDPFLSQNIFQEVKISSKAKTSPVRSRCSMSSSLGFSEEDSLHFSATETPLPSPPSPSPSGTLATPPDVYKAFEEEEFGDDKKKLFSMDTFKRRRKQQGLELQLLVAENTLLQAKLKAAVSEKEDAIQMWRKEREENKVRFFFDY